MSESRELNSDLLKEVHDYSIDLDINTIYLEDNSDHNLDNEVTVAMARKFRKNMATLVNAMVEDKDKTSIIVEINTPGGDLVSGLSIFNAVRRSKVPMTALVTGQACSTGCLILQAFKDRALEPNALVMYHSGQTGVMKPSQEFKNASECEVFYSKMVDGLVYERVLEKQPGLSRRDFDIAVMEGLYFHDPKDAIAYGLADRIATKS
jgi:ATP-dependent Clp protease protease subunit